MSYTYTSTPSHVAIRVQLNPSIDMKPKFLCDCMSTEYLKPADVLGPNPTFRTCFLPVRANSIWSLSYVAWASISACPMPVEPFGVRKALISRSSSMILVLVWIEKWKKWDTALRAVTRLILEWYTRVWQKN